MKTPTKYGVEEYLRGINKRNPAYCVHKIAATAIRGAAERHFRGRLLDIGCGNKRKETLVGDLVDEYAGIDHENCPHDQSKIDFFGTAYDIPVPNADFDSVLCTAVLEHLERPQAAIMEARRVLRPGGCAIFTAPLYWHIHEQPRDFFRYTEFGLEYLFNNAGFEILKVAALSGFWVTASAELGYYMRGKLRRGVVAPVVDIAISLANCIAPRLDRGYLRDERFTWMYMVVARRPKGDE